MSKPLSKLSQEECYAFFKDMNENSNVRWKSARLLAEQKDFGGAINSHITSTEELIKAFIMFLDSLGFEFRTIDGMDTIISRNHTIRHFIGFTMFVLNVFINDFKKYVKKSDFKFVGEYLKDKKKLESSVKWYFMRKMPLIKREFYWFAKMEKFRQSGNHVDLDSSMKSPLKISNEDYLEVYSRLNNVRKLIKEFIKMFSKEDDLTSDQFDLAIQMLKTDNLYKLLGESMVAVTKQRKNPFDLMSKNFIKQK